MALIYDLYYGDEGIVQVHERQSQIREETTKLQEIATDNQNLIREIDALQNDPDFLEEQVRTHLGAIKEDEVYVQELQIQPQPSESHDSVEEK